MNQNHHKHFKVWSGRSGLWLESRCLSWKPDEHIHFGKANANAINYFMKSQAALLHRGVITMAHLPL